MLEGNFSFLLGGAGYCRKLASYSFVSFYAEYFLDHISAIGWAIEARREERRQVGEKVAPDRPQNLGEQIRAVELCLVTVQLPVYLF